MTTDELNAIVQAVMLEMEKAGVDFDFKAETPQADDLVYVMRGTADKYMGITVKWQNLLDIIVQKATEARDEAISAKDIALQTLATIQGIESNVSSMKSSVDASEANVASMKASVETSEANVTQMKSDVSTMKASVEGTKTEVENIKEETAGLLDTKVNYADSLTYEEIMATNPVPDLTNKVASASALKREIERLYLPIRSIAANSSMLPSDFGIGIFFSNTGSNSVGFPYNYASIITIVFGGSSRGFQICSSYQGAIKYRANNTENGWTDWKTVTLS